MARIRLARAKTSRTTCRKPVDLASVLATQLTQVRIHGWVREHRFHPVRRWRVDIAFPTIKLAIECEGFGPKGKGGYHQSAEGVHGDCEKHTALAVLGWRLIRVTSKQIRSGHALRWIEATLEGNAGPLFNLPWERQGRG